MSKDWVVKTEEKERDRSVGIKMIAYPHCGKLELCLSLTKASGLVDCLKEKHVRVHQWDPFHPLTPSRCFCVPVLFPHTKDPGSECVYDDIPFPLHSNLVDNRWTCLCWIISSNVLTDKYISAQLGHCGQLRSFTSPWVWSIRNFQGKALHILERVVPLCDGHFSCWLSKFFLLNFINNHGDRQPNHIAFTVQFSIIYPCTTEIFEVESGVNLIQHLRPAVLTQDLCDELQQHCHEQHATSN